MAVYIDPARHAFGRMIMCHMMADTSAELLEMADNIGVQRKWIQKAGTFYEHFDVSKALRAKAVQFGAIEVSSMELGRLIRSRRLALRALDEVSSTGGAPGC